MALKAPNKRTPNTKTPSEVVVDAGKQYVMKKAAPPKRRPTPAPPAPKKEVSTNGKTQASEPKKQPTKAVTKSTPRASEEASNPVVAEQRKSTSSRPRTTLTREEFESHEGQLTLQAMNKLSYAQKVELWKELNAQAQDFEFYTIRTPEDLPKKLALRLDEALLREAVETKPSNREALYCPYCVAWQPFKVHSWSGCKRCCGCSMSTNDFYVKSDNDLWGKG